MIPRATVLKNTLRRTKRARTASPVPPMLGKHKCEVHISGVPCYLYSLLCAKRT